MATKYSEEIKGKTPNGGVKSIAYYLDDDGNPSPKTKATRVQIVELDKVGNRVNEVYLRKT